MSAILQVRQRFSAGTCRHRFDLIVDNLYSEDRLLEGQWQMPIIGGFEAIEE
jgi:hypothetical protein